MWKNQTLKIMSWCREASASYSWQQCLHPGFHPALSGSTTLKWSRTSFSSWALWHSSVMPLESRQFIWSFITVTSLVPLRHLYSIALLMAAPPVMSAITTSELKMIVSLIFAMAFVRPSWGSVQKMKIRAIYSSPMLALLPLHFYFAVLCQHWHFRLLAIITTCTAGQKSCYATVR